MRWAACRRRHSLGNQSVLLKHVNDDATVMKALVQKLLMCRVKPYYLYQCDLIRLGAPARECASGVEIMQQLRGRTTAMPCRNTSLTPPAAAARCLSILITF